ncbi:MAG: asnB 3 [Planctomycetaceae bacterium]|nr:asnB 3 [Planctomycetaceae bacterium]
MCGIAGAAWTSEAPPFEPSVLRLMVKSISHRGPDDEGFYRSPALPGPGAVLGHRRLSIIDLGGGHQPLCNEDGTVWIAFNGEIYNYRELQAPLEKQGHVFRTSSDTETIIHLYEQYGTECVQYLRGMFAFAIWDENRRQLFLARDRLGKKPLVYRLESQRLLFASEIKALLQVPGIPKQLDPLALDDYLTYQYVPSSRSILQGFAKLPPAHWALFRDGKFQQERYWVPAFEEPTDAHEFGSLAGARKKLRETLTEAVRLRMRSDVPLGAFLSGGVDSTIIAGLMQSLATRPIKTFSIGFPVAAFDERSYAREAAQHLGTEHHEQVIEPEALKILPKLIWHYDEPFADSSAIPMLYLSEMTRQHVTVSLSGDGGDELFAGYQRYQAVKLGGWADRLPGFVRRLLAAPFWQRLPASVAQKSKRRRLKRLLSAIGLEPRRRYLKWISIFDDDRRNELLTDELKTRLAGHDSAQFLLDAYTACPRRDFVTQTTCADILTYLPCDILTKVDISTMAYGLEARAPFLDQHVVDLAARIPIEWKLQGRQGKKILIDTFADLLPQRIQKRAKMGFGVPLDHWFRNELRPLLEDVLLSRKSIDRGLFQPDVVRRLVSEHVQGTWDHSYRLWSLLVFELWQQTFLDGPVPSQPG